MKHLDLEILIFPVNVDVVRASVFNHSIFDHEHKRILKFINRI